MIWSPVPTVNRIPGISGFQKRMRLTFLACARTMSFRQDSFPARKRSRTEAPTCAVGDLRWGRSSLADRRRLDKAANKPAPEPSGSYLLDRAIRFPMDRRGHGRQIRFVRDAEMLETLAHAPGARRRLPIELFLGQFSNQLLGGLIVSIKVCSKANGPSRRPPSVCCVHNAGHR